MPYETQGDREKFLSQQFRRITLHPLSETASCGFQRRSRDLDIGPQEDDCREISSATGGFPAAADFGFLRKQRVPGTRVRTE